MPTEPPSCRPWAWAVTEPPPASGLRGCQWDRGELGLGKVLGKSDAIITHSPMFAWDGATGEPKEEVSLQIDKHASCGRMSGQLRLLAPVPRCGGERSTGRGEVTTHRQEPSGTLATVYSRPLEPTLTT